MRPNKKNLVWIAPLAIMAMILFVFAGGEIVRLLWNWLAPVLFGLPSITFWQALGLLVLCRILFGGFGLSGSRRHGSGRHSRDRMADRVAERVSERMEEMTPEERERIRERVRERCGTGPSGGQTTPL